MDTVVGTFPVVVNNDLSEEDAIRAGNYRWVNRSRFPAARIGTSYAKIVLTTFDHSVGPEEVLRAFEAHGLRASEPREFLALGAQHPNLQESFIIIGIDPLKIRADGDRDVPFLYGGPNGRGLGRDLLNIPWPAGHRFEAVRESG